MPGQSPPTRKTLGAQVDLGLTPEDLIELVEHGGRGLILRTEVAGRTRRRMLARGGTSLHEVKRAARRRLAMSLLAAPLPLKEIAKKLGYSSTQTLSRFVRQEFGKTPIELREDLQRK
jgi:methylphosphotriester-DNA--protein-cysteine methyltransferase